MVPAPPSFSAGPQSHLRLARLRRPRNINPYDAAHQVSRSPSTQVPVTPLVDDETELEGDAQELEETEGLESEEEAEDIEEEGEEEDENEFAGDGNDDDEDVEGGIEEVPMELDPAFDPAALGLKDIGNLASWTVSSTKPGCGVEALRDDDTNLFWQSDGPQPHHLNIHFSRFVSIRAVRIYLDFNADESYTPTRIMLLAGTGYHDLIPFSSLDLEKPIGWIDVSLDHVGGGEDGKTLRAFLVQVKIVENHQNGKDTHVRGLKIYARDERVRGIGIVPDAGIPSDTETGSNAGDEAGMAPVPKVDKLNGEKGWMAEPDWMADPELR